MGSVEDAGGKDYRHRVVLDLSAHGSQSRGTRFQQWHIPSVSTDIDRWTDYCKTYVLS